MGSVKKNKHVSPKFHHIETVIKDGFCRLSTHCPTVLPYKKTDCDEQKIGLQSRPAHRAKTSCLRLGRSVNPVRPLTSGVWDGPWAGPLKRSAMARIQLDRSDVVTFHSYDDPVSSRPGSASWHSMGRPILCTEYLARGEGSTVEGSAGRQTAQRRCVHLGSGGR